jgi:hypothetical protein
VNLTPSVFEEVEVYTGDDYYSPAHAYLNNLEIISEETPD